MVLEATVRNGRILVDAPTALPEGTVLELGADGREDAMSAEETAAPNAALDRSWAEAESGALVAVEELLEKMRALRP